ncbi:hypothetical protein GOB57_08785 [Sinorhizobium meliloti]|nr:hypothetical protein [Sinorhizobium meliloti]
MQDVLQLSLFQTSDNRLTNYTALYDLAPRFVQYVERSGDQQYLSRVTREFPFNGELYSVTVYPTRITGNNGEEWDELPGEREALVEDVLRRFAADKLSLSEKDELTMPFSLYAIHQELKRVKHTLSYTEIKQALLILNGSKIEIARVVKPGEKKARPVVHAAALPVLAYKDDANPEAVSYVQFNPLLVQAIKSLEFEQVNYEWMMHIRGALPRWIFKFASITLADNDVFSDSIELRAADLVRSCGHSRSRERDALADVVKAIKRLKETGVIADYESVGVKQGKVKQDIRFTIRFSEAFMADRRSARAIARNRDNEAVRIAGTARPESFHRISSTQAAEIKMGKRRVVGTAGTQPARAELVS